MAQFEIVREKLDQAVEVLQEALSRYSTARDTASSADGAAAEAHDEKQDAIGDLADKMKHVIRYAEIEARDDEAKLTNIGWRSGQDVATRPASHSRGEAPGAWLGVPRLEESQRRRSALRLPRLEPHER